jgi:glycosyltransferase involved in cell wall biosynthesis
VIKGLGRGGAERLVTLAARRLHGRSLTVDVAYLLAHKDALVDELERAGVGVGGLDHRRSGDPRWAWRLARLVRRRGYDLVHTHSPVPAVVVRAAIRAGTPLVHTEHNVWDRFRAPTRLANAATFARNDHVFAVSSGVAASIRRPQWAPARDWPPLEVVHHGIDEQAVRRGARARMQARAELGAADGDEIVGHVATFTPKKGHHGLLTAVARLVATRLRLRLVLIGLGPLEDELRQRVRAEGLEAHVSFLGVRDDVQALLPGLDVFTLPSHHEGYPISLLEAMAAGLACVASNVGGIPEAVTDGHDGLLVPPGQPETLATTIDGLLDDADRRAALGEAAAATAQRRFSIAAAVERHERVYGELLGR